MPIAEVLLSSDGGTEPAATSFSCAWPCRRTSGSVQWPRVNRLAVAALLTADAPTEPPIRSARAGLGSDAGAPPL